MARVYLLRAEVVVIVAAVIPWNATVMDPPAVFSR